VRDGEQLADAELRLAEIPGHASIAAAARALYDGRGGALQQMITKIESAAGFRIIDRSATPLSPTYAGREFIREALQVLQAGREQTTGHPHREGT
jgi:DNA-binding transcriptional LysR family regulator